MFGIGSDQNCFYWSDGIGSIQFTLTFSKQKAAISYLMSYKYVTQLKPKITDENREQLRFRFSGKNRGFGFISVPITALSLEQRKYGALYILCIGIMQIVKYLILIIAHIPNVTRFQVVNVCVHTFCISYQSIIWQYICTLYQCNYLIQVEQLFLISRYCDIIGNNCYVHR